MFSIAKLIPFTIERIEQEEEGELPWLATVEHPDGAHMAWCFSEEEAQQFVDETQKEIDTEHQKIIDRMNFIREEYREVLAILKQLMDASLALETLIEANPHTLNFNLSLEDIYKAALGLSSMFEIEELPSNLRPWIEDLRDRDYGSP